MTRTEYVLIISKIMGLNCSSCNNENYPRFSGRHNLKNIDFPPEADKESSLTKANIMDETRVTLCCFQNGEIVAGFGLISEVQRLPDGQLSYSGWSASSEEPELLWARNYPNISAVIFTLDTDAQQIKFARKELHTFLKEEQLQEFYLLIFYNENGKPTPNSLDAIRIERKLRLKKLKSCTDYRIQPSVGKNGCGFQCGLVWLFDLLETRYKHNKANQESG